MQLLPLVLQRCKRHVLLFTVLLFMLLALGCSKKSELVGIWQNNNVQEMIEFKPNNSGIIQGQNMPPLMFVWKEIAKHTYNLDVDFQGQKKALKGVVQNETLVLEGEQGKETYRKVNSK